MAQAIMQQVSSKYSIQTIKRDNLGVPLLKQGQEKGRIFDYHNTEYYNTRYYISRIAFVRSYKFKKFASEARKVKVSDGALFVAMRQFIDLDKNGKQKYSLGSGLYKIRIASSAGRGKSAGSRSLMAFRDGDRLIWLHLFAKNNKDNVNSSELKKLKILSDVLLKMGDDEIQKLILSGELMEVKEDE